MHACARTYAQIFFSCTLFTNLAEGLQRCDEYATGHRGPFYHRTQRDVSTRHRRRTTPNMHAARNARQKTTCKISVAVVGRRRVVGRRAVSSELRAEVDKRLQEAAHPDCKAIAAQLAEEGTPVSVGFVWGRAQYLRITLPGKPGGRPSGRKDTKPRKPRTNTLYSPLRDEVLRLLAVEDGISMAEIGRRLEITRQWAAQLAGAITKQEIDAMRASVSLKKQ